MSIPPEEKSTQKKSMLASLLNGVKWTLSALLPFPMTHHGKGEPLFGKWYFSPKKLCVYLAAWWLLQPAAIMLFPRAEKSVTEAGLSATVVQQLAPGRDVYVRKDNIAGKLHAIFDDGPVKAASFFYGYMRKDSSVRAFTKHSVSAIFSNACSVYMKSDIGEAGMEDADRSFVEKESGGALTYRSPVSPQDLYRMVLMHEIRHCSAANQALPGQTLREGDSDYSAIDMLARDTGNPGLRHAFATYYSARAGGGTHDSALYIDAKLNGKPVPTNAEINAANWAAEAIERHIERSRLAGACGDGECEPDFYIKEYNLSPLAARRLVLFVEAMNETIIPKTGAKTAAGTTHAAPLAVVRTPG